MFPSHWLLFVYFVSRCIEFCCFHDEGVNDQSVVGINGRKGYIALILNEDVMISRGLLIRKRNESLVNCN